MFRDNSTGADGDWAFGAADTTPSHQEIDRHLRRLAKQRAGLDAEEARWLRSAEEQNCWRVLGYVHALEYLEDVFGYAPRTAQMKLRVAKSLGELPALEAELEAGNLPYSIVRELTRIATPQTEAAWIEKARGRNYRQVEQMLAGRKKGDEPTDAPDPSVIDHDVTWKLDAATRALLRETRRYFETELGHAIIDKTFVEMLCRRATEEGMSQAPAGMSQAPATVPRPRVMVHITTCRACKKAVQHGAGVPFELTKQQIERTECDAIVVDDEQGKRAASTIPPATRRRVFERDGYRCRFPGCRSSRNLDIHHLKHRAHGGDHSSGSLGTLCGGHHVLNHDDVISISGDADGELVFTRNGVVIRAEEETLAADPDSPHMAPEAKSKSSSNVDEARPSSRYREVERNTLAKTALQQTGFKAAIAARAVERASTRVPKDAPLEVLLREAFRHCN